MSEENGYTNLFEWPESSVSVSDLSRAMGSDEVTEKVEPVFIEGDGK